VVQGTGSGFRVQGSGSGFRVLGSGFMSTTTRRGFLLLKLEPRGPALVVDCRRLYMRSLDADLSAHAAVGSDTAVTSWEGEPPARFERWEAGDLIREVERDLVNVRRVRVVNRHWLASAPFAVQFEEALAMFRARGGEIEFVDGSDD